jgi:hypothetical protein
MLLWWWDLIPRLLGLGSGGGRCSDLLKWDSLVAAFVDPAVDVAGDYWMNVPYVSGALL